MYYLESSFGTDELILHLKDLDFVFLTEFANIIDTGFANIIIDYLSSLLFLSLLFHNVLSLFIHSLEPTLGSDELIIGFTDLVLYL